jgi:polar amino acid transport system substrate-binding protein
MRFFYLCSLLLAFAAQVRAADATLCLNRPIRFSQFEYGLHYSSGYGGIDEDLQKEMARRSGCRFEVNVRPRARIWYELKEGATDMAGAGTQTPERDQFAWFIPYAALDWVVVLGPNVPKNLHSFDQFMANKQLTLGSVRSYRYSPFYDRYVDQLIATGRYTEMGEPELLYRMFAANRFDALIETPALYLYYVNVKKQAMPTRREQWDPTGAMPASLVISKRNFSELQEKKWRALVAEILADGTMDKILIKHLGNEYGPKTRYKPATKERKQQ